MKDLSTSKKLARAAVRAARTARADQRPERDHAIQSHLLKALSELPAVPSTLTIAGYVPLPGEPGGADLADVIASTGARVLLPRVSRDKASASNGSPSDGTAEGSTHVPVLEWVEFHPENPNLVAGTWGILEPEGNAIHTFPTCADVIITPALAIDYHGIRLGQGGGFYDRALADRPSHINVWAVVDHEEFTRIVPSREHDLVVDAVINDLGFFPVM